MSKNFELMNQGVPETEAVQPPARGALRSKPNLRDRYLQSVADAPEEKFAASLWRIIRSRKRTVAALTLAAVVIVVTASLLMKPQYEAVGQRVLHREHDSGALGFKGVDTSLAEAPA